MKRKLFGLIFMLCLLMGLSTTAAADFGNYYVTGETDAVTHLYSVLTITKDCTVTIANTNSYTPELGKIVVQEGVTANITLNGLNRYTQSTYGGDLYGDVLTVESGATVNITLIGDNTLVSQGSNAGLRVSPTATVTIDGGTVTATGGWNCAGIGNGYNGSGGTVTAIGGGASSTKAIDATTTIVSTVEYATGATEADCEDFKIGTGSQVTTSDKVLVAQPLSEVDPELNITAGAITLTAEGRALFYAQDGGTPEQYAGGITITGSTTQCNVTVESGTHDITLNDMSIDLTDSDTTKTSAFMVNDTATANITLKGDNKLFACNYNTVVSCAGLQVAENAAVIIDGTGSLTAQGGRYGYQGGAGIGGVYDSKAGTITINGGTITAQGGTGGAGIGGGGLVIADIQECKGGGATVVINGGIVTAKGGLDAAGIGGGGGNFYNGSVAINGGFVMASAGDDSYKNQPPGIGAGSSEMSVTVSIDFGAMEQATSEESLANCTEFQSKMGFDGLSQYVIVRPNPIELNIADGNITLATTGTEQTYQQGSAGAVAYLGAVEITGTSTQYGVTVSGEQHEIILNGVNITGKNGLAINVTGSAIITLASGSANSLTDGENHPALKTATSVPINSVGTAGTLTITGGSSQGIEGGVTIASTLPYKTSADGSTWTGSAYNEKYVLEGSFSSGTAITAFTIEGQIGTATIDTTAKTVNIIMPAGSTVSDVSPVVTVPTDKTASFDGATVTGDSLKIGTVTVTKTAGTAALTWNVGEDTITIPKDATATVTKDAKTVTVTGLATVAETGIGVKATGTVKYSDTLTYNVPIGSALNTNGKVTIPATATFTHDGVEYQSTTDTAISIESATEVSLPSTTTAKLGAFTAELVGTLEKVDNAWVIKNSIIKVGTTSFTNANMTMTIGASGTASVIIPVNTTITVNGKEYKVTTEAITVTVDENGVVTLPTGGTLTNSECTITATANSTINTAGTMTLQTSSTVEKTGTPANKVSVDDTATYNGDGTVTVSGDSTLTFGDDTDDNDETVTLPDGATVTVDTNGDITIPAGTRLEKSDMTITVKPGGAISTNGVNVIIGDTESALKLDDTEMKVPTDTLVSTFPATEDTITIEVVKDTNSATVQLMEDAENKLETGMVTAEEVKIGDDTDRTTTLASTEGNLTVTLEGKVTFPEGGTVTTKDDEDNETTRDVSKNTSVTVDKSGSVTYPSTTPATYKSTLAATENGTATLSTTKAQLNKTVTVTTKPNAGFEVADVVVTYSSGRKVAVTDNGNGNYTYLQPGASVTVTVTFVEIGTSAQIVTFLYRTISE